MSITGYEELSNEAFVITTSFYLGLRPQRLVQFSHCAHDASSRALVSPWADLAATIVSSSRSAHTVSHNHLRVDGLVCTFMTEASVPTSRTMRFTTKRPGTYSSSSVTSSPTRLSLPPQALHAVPASRICS